MSLQSIVNINVDFYDREYIMINAKQYDSSSRWISITCYDRGNLFNLSASKHTAYIRYRKADGNGVLNSCRINYKGEVLVELTEQMLAADGICYVDLIIVNKGSAVINIDTGEVVTVDGSAIISTMAFCVNVYESAVDNSFIESTYEANALNELIQKAEAEYIEVIRLAKSYAIGTDNTVRENDEEDNARYYSQLSATSASNAVNNEENSRRNADLAKSYAVGETGVRENEDTDNAYYYYGLVKNVAENINNSFIPMGTITFSALATAEKVAGYTYNISDDFITDENFAEGAGKSYTAGTNVYCRSDGMWDCFGGSASAVATVDEVKSYLGI